jgi:hypothetical protein
MNKITFKKPIALSVIGKIYDITIYISEIRVLRSGKPYAVYTKDDKRYDFVYLTKSSKKLVEKIVEKKHKIPLI